MQRTMPVYSYPSKLSLVRAASDTWKDQKQLQQQQTGRLMSQTHSRRRSLQEIPNSRQQMCQRQEKRLSIGSGHSLAASSAQPSFFVSIDMARFRPKSGRPNPETMNKTAKITRRGPMLPLVLSLYTMSAYTVLFVLNSKGDEISAGNDIMAKPWNFLPLILGGESKSTSSEQVLRLWTDADEIFDCHPAQNSNLTANHIYDNHDLNQILPSCQYFRPAEFFRKGQPGYKYRNKRIEMGGGLEVGRGVVQLRWSFVSDLIREKVEKSMEASLVPMYPWYLPPEITFYDTPAMEGTAIREALEGLEEAIKEAVEDLEGDSDEERSANTVAEQNADTQMDFPQINASQAVHFRDITVQLKSFVDCQPNCDESVKNFNDALRQIQLHPESIREQNGFIPNDEAYAHLKKAGLPTPPKPTTKPVAFAIVNDPIKRFLSLVADAARYTEELQIKKICFSSAAQHSSDGDGVTHTSISQSNTTQGLSTTKGSFSHTLLLDQARTALQCAISRIQTNGLNQSTFFVPMAISLEANANDVELSLLHISRISHALGYIQGPYLPQDIYLSEENSGPGAILRQVLRGMTMEDLTAEMKRDLCEMYEVDVDMMEYAGFEVPACSIFRG